MNILLLMNISVNSNAHLIRHLFFTYHLKSCHKLALSLLSRAGGFKIKVTSTLSLLKFLQNRHLMLRLTIYRGHSLYIGGKL